MFVLVSVLGLGVVVVDCDTSFIAISLHTKVACKSTLSNRGGENPLDYPAMMADPAELVIVAADARTGKARYFMKDELRQDDYTPLMASCCIPVIDQPTFIDGVPYYDGGLADPVPVDKALAMGCDRVAVILTKPVTLERNNKRDEKLAGLLRHKYPKAAEGLALRAERYNAAVRQAQALEEAAGRASSPRTAPRGWPH